MLTYPAYRSSLSSHDIRMDLDFELLPVRGHEDKIVTKELEGGNDETEIQP